MTKKQIVKKKKANKLSKKKYTIALESQEAKPQELPMIDISKLIKDENFNARKFINGMIWMQEQNQKVKILAMEDTISPLNPLGWAILILLNRIEFLENAMGLINEAK